MNPETRAARPANSARRASHHGHSPRCAAARSMSSGVSSRSRYALSAPSDQHCLIPHLRNACETCAQKPVRRAPAACPPSAAGCPAFARVRSKPSRWRATAIVARLWVSERPATVRTRPQRSSRSISSSAPAGSDTRRLSAPAACSHRRRREFRRSASRPALVATRQAHAVSPSRL